MEEDQYIKNLIKLSELTLTNSETLLLSRSNAKGPVDACVKTLANKNKVRGLADFLSCISGKMCPTEYSAFLQCMKEKKDHLPDCLPQFYQLNNALTRLANKSIYEIDNIKL